MKEQKIIIEEIDKMNYVNDDVLLITSNYFNNVNKKYIEVIIDKVKNAIIYDKVKFNPTLDMVVECINLLKENKCNKIIALGGGSVIDVAKAVSLFYDFSKEEIWGFFKKESDISKLTISKDIIAIPTTFGTGSEHNRYCVITNNDEKRSISSNLLIPNIVYKDKNFIDSLCISQRILGIFDCFMHAVECYLSNKSTDKSKKISILCIDSVLKVVNNLDNIEWSDIMEISRLSGEVENLSSCISLHSLGHSISSLNSNIIHGESIMLIARKYFGCYYKLKNNQIFELDNYIKLHSSYNSLNDVIKVIEDYYFNINRERSNALINYFFDLSKNEIILKAKKLACLDDLNFANDPIKLFDEHLLECLDIDFLNIKEEILKYVELDDIYYVNSNCGIGSHDTDIYCVVRGRGSSTHCYYDKNGKWVEIFIDSLENLNYKIETSDALGINYASMLNFYFGDKQLYKKKYEECMDVKNNYVLYKLDELLLTYRVQISFEKISNKNHEYSNRMLCSALVYPFITLLMGIYHVFPSSPRNWLAQLEDAMGDDFEDLTCLFDGKYNYVKIEKLINKYTKKLNQIDLYFEGKNRRSRVE